MAHIRLEPKSSHMTTYSQPLKLVQFLIYDLSRILLVYFQATITCNLLLLFIPISRVLQNAWVKPTLNEHKLK